MYVQIEDQVNCKSNIEICLKRDSIDQIRLQDWDIYLKKMALLLFLFYILRYLSFTYMDKVAVLK